MKAKLIIDMPENCETCPLANLEHPTWYCTGSGEAFHTHAKNLDKIRAPNCPLKPVEEVTP